jgi:hypothetical protein
MPTKKKPTTVKDWEKVCENLRAALHAMIDEEAKMKKQIDKLEDQLVMSHGVIKYLEMKLERSNPV